MRRARSTDNSNTISLFPFLAVLLCTMGSLIVLLVVMARQARVQAAQEAQAAGGSVTSPEDSAKQQRELQQRIDQLEASRKAVREKLIRERLTLSHLEDHMRRLAEHLVELQLSAKQLEEAKESKSQDHKQAEAEVARLRRLVAETTEQLEEARREAAGRRRSYAVIPYQGTSKTHRRPIYIECRADAVVLQPEGISLTRRDFQRPLGPGNPLASALRAAREYYSQADRKIAASASADSATESYPLILVRPDGIPAYYEVRMAIESWGSDFGYELVEQDWKLEFPLPNPQLARAERHAVELARARRERLAQTAPSLYIGGGRPTYRATSRRGGFQREASSDIGSFAGRRASDSKKGSKHERHASKTNGGSDKGPNPDARSADSRSVPTFQGSTKRTSKANLNDGKPNSEQPNTERPVFGQPSGKGSSPSFSSGLGDSLKDRRGRNWALPAKRSGAVPISRPVRVVCRGDRLAILPDRSSEEGKVILLGSSTEEAIDDFVSALWDHMKTWGIAGRGLYWRPILVLHVGPDGEKRAAELRKILEGSGLEVREQRMAGLKGGKR